MAIFRSVVACGLLMVSAGMARADGLLYNLPKDGAWATYDLAMAIKVGDRAGNVTGTLRLASVGQATEDNQPCRWIEVQVDTETALGDHKQKESITNKILVPEKYLAKGQAPLEHAIRIWQQRQDGKPERDPKNNEGSPLQIILSGPWKNPKPLDKTSVETKLGKFECEGVEGTLELKLKPDGALNCKLENRLAPESPFGVVSSHWVIEGPPMGGKSVTMHWDLKLSETGKNATSKMPDAK